MGTMRRRRLSSTGLLLNVEGSAWSVERPCMSVRLTRAAAGSAIRKVRGPRWRGWLLSCACCLLVFAGSWRACGEAGGTELRKELEPVRKADRPTTKGLRVRMGRTPAEDFGDAELQILRSCFLPLIWSVCGNTLQRIGWMDHSMGPIRPHGLVENATAPSAGGSPDGLELWDWVCSLHGWPEGHSLEAASSEIRTLGLNSPTFVLWNLSWHGYRAMVPVRIAAGEGRDVFHGFADFQNRAFPVQRIDRGFWIGHWLLACPVSPFSYQTVQPSARPSPEMRIEVDATPDGWRSLEWGYVWENITGGLRELDLGGGRILEHPLGLGLVPTLPGARRPGLPIRGLEWVESGPLRWACEMELDPSWAAIGRMEYCVNPRMIRFSLRGKDLPGREYRIFLPKPGEGVELVLGEHGPEGRDWFWGWHAPARGAVATLHLRGVGTLNPSLGPEGDGLLDAMDWRVPRPADSETEQVSEERVLLEWTLRGGLTEGDSGWESGLSALLQEEGQGLRVIPVPQQAGSRVAAGAGIILRGPVRFAGAPTAGGSPGEWLVPMRAVVAGGSGREFEGAWQCSIWFESPPRSVEYQVWVGAGQAPPTGSEWTALGPARHSFDLRLAQPPKGVVWLRVRT